MKNILSKRGVITLYSKMREKGISTSAICKALNIDYPCFKAMLDQKQPCYGKWQKVIADMLGISKKELFEEIIPKYAEVDEIAQRIAEEYQKNLNNPYIFKPLANATYKVWKEVDEKEQAKL